MKKRIVSMMLCVAMAATMMVGCGSKEEEAAAPAPAETEAPVEEEAEEPAEEVEEPEEAEASEETAGGTLVMGTNAEFPPYEYREGDQIVGIDAEMAAAVAEKLGMELKIEDMAFDAIIPALTSGKVDMGVAGMTVTEDRLMSVNFSDTYATARQVIIVTEDSEIAGVADLTGKTIGVQQGTTGDLYASEEDATIERFAKGMEAVMSLSQGKIDAVVIDSEPAKVFVSEVEGIKILDETYADEEYAIAIAKEDTELLEKVNTALAELEADGTLQAIVDKYISAE